MDMDHAIASRRERASLASLVTSAQSRRPGLRRALERVEKDARSHLASLRIVNELVRAYELAMAQATGNGRTAQLPEAFGRLLHEMTERARETGDPLPYNSGVVDVSEAMRRAASLAAPVLAGSGSEIHMDLLAPLVVAGDSKLLVEALAGLMGLLAGEASDGSVLQCTATLRGDKAVVRMTMSRRGGATDALDDHLDPFGAASNRRAGHTIPTDLGAWCARLIIERHGGTVTPAAATDVAQLEVTLPGRLL